MKTLKISLPWSDRHMGTSGVLEVETEARNPVRFYKLRALDYRRFISEWEARRMAQCALSEIAFCDALDLEPCTTRDWRHVFSMPGRTDQHAEADRKRGGGPHYGMLPGFDHSRLWRQRLDPMRFLISTEPYKDDGDDTFRTQATVQHSCAERGWPCFVYPDGVGFWNPSKIHGTRLVLVSPYPRGVDLVTVRRKLDAILDRLTIGAEEEPA